MRPGPAPARRPLDRRCPRLEAVRSRRGSRQAQPDGAVSAHTVARLALAGCLVALAGSARSAPAAFPGANGKVAFTAVGAGRSTIEVVGERGGRPNVLVRLPGSSAPAWSADGNRLAFVNASADGSVQSIY